MYSKHRSVWSDSILVRVYLLWKSIRIHDLTREHYVYVRLLIQQSLFIMQTLHI